MDVYIILHLGIHVDSTINHGQLFPGPRDKTTVIAVLSSCKILHRCMLYLGPLGP